MASHQIPKVLTALPQGAERRLKQPNVLFFTAGINYKAVFDLPSIKELFSRTLSFCFSRSS